jgi:uncharacterized spore protein YtfJ
MTVEALLAKASEGFNAGRAFGPIIERDDCLIIPVAFVMGGGGGGDALESTEGTAGATGGGFGGVTWPIGAYVVKDGQVRWMPAVDATLVALGALLVVRTVLKVRARSRARALRG